MHSIFILLLLLIPSLGWDLKLEFKNITFKTTTLSKDTLNKSAYQLTANYHLKEFSQKDIYLILMNSKHYMLKHNYYADGKLITKKTSLSYKKAYIYSSKVYLFDVSGTINDMMVRAKEVEYDGHKNYLLKHCEIKDNHKIYRRRSFIIIEIPQ